MIRNLRSISPLFLALAFGVAAVPAAGAGLSLTQEYTTGSLYHGYESRAALDLGADKAWGLETSYARSDSTAGAGSSTRQLTADLTHDMDDSWDARFGLTGWRDVLNNVEYGGPSVSFSYTALRDDAGVGDDSDDELFKTSYNADLFALRADETTSPKRIFIERKLVVLPPQQGNVTLAQWHPSFEIEKPLGKIGGVIPRLSFGHFFYSKNPALIEARAGRPRFAASAGSINGLVGGMPKNEAKTGITFLLPGKTELDASLGGQQLATDNSWAATQTASIAQKYFKRLHAEFIWSRTIQNGRAQDLYTGGLTLIF